MTVRTNDNLQISLYMTRLLQYKKQSCLQPLNANKYCMDVDNLLKRLSNLKIKISDPYKTINRQFFDHEIQAVKKALGKIN